MKKVILITIPIFIIIGITLIVIFGRSNNKISNNETNQSITKYIPERPMREIEETEELKALPQKLQDVGIETKKNTELKFEKAGAICGYVLKPIKDETASITILQYDKKSSEYKQTEKEQKVTMRDENGNEISGFSAKVKNGFAYKITGNFPKYDEVVNILNNLKV